MNAQTLAEIQATIELVKLVRSRVDAHADYFTKDYALTLLTRAENKLSEVINLLREVPTMENEAVVLRASLRLIEKGHQPNG